MDHFHVAVIICVSEQMTWLEIQMPRISPRAGHVALNKLYRYEDNGNNDVVMIFGGGNNEDTFYNDLYSVSIPFDAGKKVEKEGSISESAATTSVDVTTEKQEHDAIVDQQNEAMEVVEIE